MSKRPLATLSTCQRQGNSLSVIAVFALPIGFLAGGVAFNAARKGELALMVKSGAVFLACCALFALAPTPRSFKGDDCIRYSQFAETC